MLAAIPAAFSGLPGATTHSVAAAVPDQTGPVSRYLVPAEFADQLPPVAIVLHRYEDRLLVSVPEGRLYPQQRKRSSRLADPGRLSYRGWSGSMSEATPDALETVEDGYFLLGLIGPVDPAWREELRSGGLQLVDTASPHGLLVRGDDHTIQQLASSMLTSEGEVVIRHALPLPEQTRTAPDVAAWLSGRAEPAGMGMRTEEGRALVRVELHADADPDALHPRVLALLQRGPEFIPGRHATQFRATAPGIVRLLEEVPEVAFVHGEYERVPFNNLAAHESVMNVRPVWNEPALGYTGQGIVVGINDSGAEPSHPDFHDPAYEDVFIATAGSMESYEGDPGPFGDPGNDNFHGTHVSGSVLGRGYANPESPTNPEACAEEQDWTLDPVRGTAWGAQGTHNSLWGGGFTDEEDMMLWSYQQGAHLNTNSWGYPIHDYAGFSAVIDQLVRDVDSSAAGNQEFTMLFAAANDGPDPETIASPGNAKNVITVGGSLNPRYDSRMFDGDCSTFDAETIINSMVGFSSRGPAQGRIKPDVVAPAALVLSTAGDGDDLGWDNDTWTGDDYSLLGGTSMATPLVAGATALFFEFFQDEFETFPSPALTRGAFINGATDMGMGFPSFDQGWGRVNLEHTIQGPDGGGVQFIDQDEVTHLSTGNNWTTDVGVLDAAPLKITLTWTDPAGSAGCGDCLINDLDLIVTAPDGTVFRGNQFDGGWSEPDPAGRDDINNVENVYVESPTPGLWTIEVVSVETGENPANLDGQDFAMVISGAFGSACDDPDAPSGLSASTAATDNAIDLSWDAIVSDSYNVYRSDTSGGPWDLVASGIETESHTDSPVTAGEEQFYVVTAFNDPSCESDFSNEDSAVATGFVCSDLDAPTGLTATVETAGQVDLDWDGVALADSYNVYRADDSGGPYDLLASEVSATTFSDTSVESGESYYYVVTAVHADSGCESDQSDEASIALAPGIDVSPATVSFSIAPDDGDSQAIDVGNVGSEDLEWEISDDSTDVDETLSIPDFSVSGVGAPEEFDIPGGQATRGEVTGFSFQGTVTGVSGNADWASDLKMVMTAPDGSSFDVGGYDDVENDWDFQGDGSADDGTYASDHPGAFDSGDLGDWNFQFTHDWGAGGIMNWSDVTVVLQKTPLEECDSPADVGWLDLVPMEGIVNPGDATEVVVTVDSTGLAEDTYQADICVLSNDPETPMVVVPIELVVSDESNPVPTVTNLDPDEIEVGSPDLNLTVAGSDFVSDSVVRFDGLDLTTTFVNENELEAVVPEFELTDADTVDVTVFNPAPGGGESGPVTFIINQATSTTDISSITPTDEQTVNEPYTVTVNVDGFDPGGTVDVDDGAGANCQITLPDDSCELTSTSVGVKTITANYGGDVNNAGSMDNVVYAIVESDSTTTITAIDPAGSQTVGESYTVTVSVTGENPTGTVDVDDGTGGSCQITLSGGAGSCAVTSTTVGAKTIAAVYGGDANNDGSQTTSGYTIVADQPHQLVFSVQPEDAISLLTMDPVVVHVQDEHGNLVDWDDASEVSLSLIGGDTEAVLAGGDAITVSGGVASFSALSIDLVGSDYQLEAEATGLTGATSFEFEVFHGEAESLLFIDQPTTTEVNATITPAVTVSVLDAAGNLADTDNDTEVELTLTGGDGGATLSGATTMTVEEGMATFADLSVDTAGTGYQLNAADGAEELSGDASELFAVVGPTTYTVTPSAGTGGSIDPDTAQTVIEGETAEFTITADEGYTLDLPVGGTCGGSLDGNTFTTAVVTEDCTVAASFTQNTYEVTPSAGAGGDIDPDTVQTVAHGSTVSFALTPDEGYSIDAVGGTCGGSLDGNTFTTAVVTEDCTVAASFTQNTYEVTPSAGAGGDIDPDTVQTVAHGSTVSFALTPDEGYSIDAVGGTCGGSLDGNTFTTAAVTEDCTVAASFTQNTYEVTFEDHDGTELDSQTVNHGDAATAPADPEREGYSFTGWDTDFSEVTEDLTVTAQYEINTYTVTFVDHDSEVLGTDEVEHGSGATAPADPERDGYSFTGWDTDFSEVTEDLTVTAQYEINTYTVTFVDHDSEVLGTDEVEHGSGATAPADPEREGYSFTGWDTDYSEVTSDLTVTAQYEINTYTVTFVDHDSEVLGTDEVEHGNGATAPADPEREGYSFTGWDTDFSEVTSDLMVTAQYEINTYTVTFVDHDSEVLGTDEVEHGSGATAPADPEREGYSFTGWDTDYSEVTSDLTVTAQYEINTYTIAVSADPSDGGAVSGGGMYDHGEEVTVTATPEDGYSFANWSEDDAAVSTSASYEFTVEDDRTLVANFSENESFVSIESINPEGSQVVGQVYVVTVSVDGADPTGEVTVSDGEASCVFTLPGETSCEMTSTSAGEKMIEAEYAGDDNNPPASASTAFTIDKAEVDLVIESVDPSDFQVAGLSYNVEISIGGYNPSGVVNVTDGEDASCTIELPQTGCGMTSSASGDKTITATYDGDDNNLPDSDSMTYEIESSGPFTLIFNVSPVSAVEFGPLQPGVVVHVLDSEDQLVDDDNSTQVSIVLETNPHEAELSGTTSVTVTNGVAEFTDLSIDEVGEGYRLQASDAGGLLEPALSDFFDVAVNRLFHDRFEENDDEEQ
jgi:hypothetical protein